MTVEREPTFSGLDNNLEIIGIRPRTELKREESANAWEKKNTHLWPPWQMTTNKRKYQIENEDYLLLFTDVVGEFINRWTTSSSVPRLYIFEMYWWSSKKTRKVRWRFLLRKWKKVPILKI